MAHTKAKLVDEATKRKIQLYPVATAEDIAASSQLDARDYWETVEYPELGGSLSYPSALFKNFPTSHKRLEPAPSIGEHNEEIYVKRLKLTQEQLILLSLSELLI